MNAQIIYNILRENGLSKAGALGMIGNIELESHCNPHAHEPNQYSESYTREIDDGSISKNDFILNKNGYGLCQWSLAYRREKLWNYAYQNMMSIGSLELQSYFILHELKTEYEYKDLYKFLCETENLYEATSEICRVYERPTINNIKDRYDAAMQYNNSLSEKSEGPETEEEGEIMTQEEAIHEVVSLAYGEVGYREGANNYNKYADDPLITQLYGWKLQNHPWCAVFVNWLFLSCFGYYQGSNMTYGGSPGCAVQASYYKNNGAYYPAQNARVGDQIFFIRSGNINHTGIVVDVSGSTIHTVEGNTSDSVAERTYSIDDSSIAGVGRPLWSIVSDCDDDREEQDQKKARGYVEIKYGDGIDAPLAIVKAWQSILLAWGYNLGVRGADGEFGEKTMKATKKLQTSVGIIDDGIVGKETWEQGILFPMR